MTWFNLCRIAPAHGNGTGDRLTAADWFRISRLSPAHHGHTAAFDELADMLHFGLEALGHRVNVLASNRVGARGINLVLGAHLLGDAGGRRLAPHTILYNTEQIHPESGWRPHFVAVLGRCVVWDYSRRNLERIRQLTGNDRLWHAPVGYVPQLTRIVDDDRQDIDVLFYGTLNERRRRVLAALEAAGLSVHCAFGLYGAARDRLIARAKVVLNVHYYAAGVFEIVRVAYLLANRKAVVTECADESEIDADLRDGVRLARYDDLVAACRELVGDAVHRARLGEAGFTRMTARPAAQLLRPAVTAALSADAEVAAG
jgi:hypothetical protein